MLINVSSPIVSLTKADTMVKCNCSSSSISVYLSSSILSEPVTVKKEDTSFNTVTIYPATGETIDGLESTVLTLDNQYKTFTPTNGGWSIVDETNAIRYDDFNVPLTIGKPTAGGKPDFDYTNTGYLFPQNDKTEILIVRCQLPHRWKEGSIIFPHVHWRQSRNEVAVFKIDYMWYNNGEAPPTEWTTYTMDSYAFTYTSGTLGQISKGADGISGEGKEISSILLIKLYREDNVYVGDALVDDFDIHIQIDSNGSNLEYVK